MNTHLSGLHASCALDDLARSLYANHQKYIAQPVRPWAAVPFNVRQVYLEISARSLRMMCEPSSGATTTDALFHLANALGRAEITTGLRPILGKVIGTIGVRA